MPRISGGELLVKALEKQGAEIIFSIPGGQLLGVYEAIRRSKSLSLLVPRQEGASALMACGYALAGDGPGVVISTVGAGVIYELSGIYYAWLNRLPIISIAPQVQSFRIKPIQENLQALDQDELFAPITKFHSIIYHYSRIVQLLQRAYRIALAPEPGPVHLDLPLDIAFEKKYLRARALAELISDSEKTRFTGKMEPDPEELEKAMKIFSKAKKPLALIGAGMRRLGYGSAIDKFFSKSKIPALCSKGGFSSVPRKSGAFVAGLDFYQDGQSQDLIQEADLYLLLEPDAELAFFLEKINRAHPQKPTIQISNNPTGFYRFGAISSALAGSPDLILNHLWRAPFAEKEESLEKLIQNQAQVFKQAQALIPEHRLNALDKVFSSINRVLTDEDFVVVEGKEAVLCAQIYLENYGSGRVILVPETAPRGSGFPLALGIKAKQRRAKVFLVSERESFKVHSRELQTGFRYHLGICSLVIPEEDKLRETEPDLAMLAKSLGVKGVAVQEPIEEINEELLGQAFELESGLLLEIRGF